MKSPRYFSNWHLRGGAGTVTRMRPLLLGVVLFCGIACTFGESQQTSGRKIQRQINPQYPELARRMNLSGTVNLMVTVAPDGAVKECKVMGGHPVLAQAAVDAVKRWRYEAAKAQSVTTVNIKFRDHN